MSMLSGAVPIEGLLTQGESTALDYKRDQYAFENGSMGQKAELLKDILAFANASRGTDAYILIGVEEAANGTGRVVGVTTHLRDADLQQFVNEKTNRPVAFAYFAVPYKEHELGVLRIPRQERPFYLKKRYGEIKANDVYVRHGSSNAIATPEELLAMGTADAVAAAHPVLRLELADLDAHVALGVDTTARFEILIPSDELLREDVPDPWSVGTSRLLRRASRGERAEFIARRSLSMAFGFCVTNISAVLARNVRVELEAADGPLRILDNSEGPDDPDPTARLMLGPRVARSVDVEHFAAERTILTAVFGNVQPGASAYTEETFLVNIPFGGPLPLESDPALRLTGWLYEDASRPAEVTCVIHHDVTTRDMGLADLARPRDEDDDE